MLQSFEPKAEDVADFTAKQKLVFLDKIKSLASLGLDQIRLMGKVYGFAASKNAELKTSYYLIALNAGDSSCSGGVVELLGSVGRMKFVRPLFRALNKFDRKLALETFEKYRDFYHPICRSMVQKDLGIKG